VDQDPSLTPDEDAELRLLHGLRSFGAVARSIGTRYDALRSRDRRKTIREPEEMAVVQEGDKGPWTGLTAQVIPAENPPEEPEPMASDDTPAPRVVPGPRRTDSHEVLAGETDRRRFFR
jgi:hypothetical protein